MIACGIALTFWGMKRPLTTLECVLLPIGVFGSTALAIFSFFTSTYAKQHSFIDSFCKKVYKVPLTLIQVSAALYLFCAALVILGFVLGSWLAKIASMLENTHLLSISLRGWFNLSFAMTEFLLLWATFILIIVVRERSKTMFGSSYGDNAMGYGQIMAIGFCIQTVFQAGPLAFSKRRPCHVLQALCRANVFLPGRFSDHNDESLETARTTSNGGKGSINVTIRQTSKTKNWVRYRFETMKHHHLRTEPL